MTFTPPPIGPDGHPLRPPQVPQPGSIRLAVRLLWSGAALSLFGLVLTLATLDSLKAQLRDSVEKRDPVYADPEMDRYTDVFYGALIGGAVIGAVLGVALWSWMAWKNGQGRSWARILATVFGGIGLPSTVSSLALGREAGVGIVVAVLFLVLSVVILVLLWRKESSEFYAARSRPQWS